MSVKFLPGKKTAEILGVHPQTLYKYEEKGLIKTIRTPGGKRLYNVEEYLNKQGVSNQSDKVKISYCRVSGASQKDDLENQVNYMKDKYPNHEMIIDIGSGINFERKGLKKIMKLGIEGKLEELVITYKDRLCRIGYEMIENILTEYSKTKIIVINDKEESAEEEVVNDLIEIITVFSARVYGLRRYKKALESDKKLK